MDEISTLPAAPNRVKTGVTRQWEQTRFDYFFFFFSFKRLQAFDYRRFTVVVIRGDSAPE